MQSPASENGSRPTTSTTYPATVPPSGPRGEAKAASWWTRMVGTVAAQEVAATFGFRRRIYVWVGLVSVVLGVVSLGGWRVGLSYLEGPTAFVALAGLGLIFLVYRCPMCGCTPTASLLARPDACRKCGVRLL
jgi:hypothetical protein